jgi:hypothetical protein
MPLSLAGFKTHIYFYAGLNGSFQIPDMIYHTSSRPDFINRIYPQEELSNSPNNPSFFIGRAILSYV